MRWLGASPKGNSERCPQLRFGSPQGAILPMLVVTKGLPKPNHPNWSLGRNDDRERIELPIPSPGSEDVGFERVALGPGTTLGPVQHHRDGFSCGSQFPSTYACQVGLSEYTNSRRLPCSSPTIVKLPLKPAPLAPGQPCSDRQKGKRQKQDRQQDNTKHRRCRDRNGIGPPRFVLRQGCSV